MAARHPLMGAGPGVPFWKERFGGDVDKLRRIGIRTILDFQTVCEFAEQRAQIAAGTEVSKLKIALIYQQTKDDKELAETGGISKPIEFLQAKSGKPDPILGRFYFTAPDLSLVCDFLNIVIIIYNYA